MTREKRTPMKCKAILMMLFIVVAGVFPDLTSARTRLALVIGNSAYSQYTLNNPRNDAADMATILQQADFEVTHLYDLDRRSMARSISEFISKLEKTGAVGLFYYAGHGVEVDGVNYLLPLNMEVSNSSELEFEAINVQRLLRQMEKARNGLNIVMIDACRNNPFRSYRGGNNSRGLKQINAPLGSIISSSTASGEVAADGVLGRNSPYTRQLLAHFNTPGLSLAQFFMRVRIGVLAETNGTQIPWETSSLTEDFFFYPATKPQPKEDAPTADMRQQQQDEIVVAGGIDVDSLLEECEAHFDANRLSRSTGGTALECYKEVLVIQPGQPDALMGLSKIESKYVAWAKRELGRNNLKKAQQYLKHLQTLNPEHDEIENLKMDIAELSRTKPAIPVAQPERPVESPTLIAGIYRDHDDGTVTDTRTGLQWMRCSMGQILAQGKCHGNATTTTYKGALKAGEVEIYRKTGGYSDWRVPSMDEMRSLVYCSSEQPYRWNKSGDPCKGDYKIPTINAEAFPGTPSSSFWSASSYAKDSNYAWYVYFGDGKSSTSYLKFGKHVRLVRNEQ